MASRPRRLGESRRYLEKNGLMPDLNSWIDLFRSDNRTIKIRAAKALLARDDAPLWTLLEILDKLSYDGLGALAERQLLTRRDDDLLDAMLQRLASDDNFVREVACSVLGAIGNSNATTYLLNALNDPHIMVRRAAGFAIGRIGDQNAIPELTRIYTTRSHETNVRWAIETALRSLGVDPARAK